MDEEAEIVSVKFDKVMQSPAYTVMVLATPDKKFGIYADPTCGKSIQMFLTESKKPRPSTHELLQMLFKGFDIKIKHVVITDLQETIYFCRLFLEQRKGDLLYIVEVDARPSDCILLALVGNAPIYCVKHVLEQAISIEHE